MSWIVWLFAASVQHIFFNYYISWRLLIRVSWRSLSFLSNSVRSQLFSLWEWPDNWFAWWSSILCDWSCIPDRTLNSSLSSSDWASDSKIFLFFKKPPRMTFRLRTISFEQLFLLDEWLARISKKLHESVCSERTFSLSDWKFCTTLESRLFFFCLSASPRVSPVPERKCEQDVSEPSLLDKSRMGSRLSLSWGQHSQIGSFNLFPIPQEW